MSEETTEAPAAEEKAAPKTYEGKVGEIIETLKGMTLLEISELKTAFEDTFDVKAASGGGMMMAMPAGGGGGGGEAEAEQTEFDVILDAVGGSKIQVIKVLRALTSLGLKEAKAIADEAPKPVLEAIGKEAAEDAKKQLEEAGATVSVK